jgi:hypothetical protein
MQDMSKHISKTEALNVAISAAKKVPISVNFSNRWRSSQAAPELRESSTQAAPLKEIPEPQYIPKKSGKDTATEVETRMVFNFEDSLEDLSEFIVSRILEDATLSVQEEDTLAKLRARRQKIAAKIAAEDLRIREIEDQEKRKVKDELKTRTALTTEQKDAAMSKLLMMNAVKGYLSGLEDSSIKLLETAGKLSQENDLEILEIKREAELLLGSSGAAREWVKNEFGI